MAERPEFDMTDMDDLGTPDIPEPAADPTPEPVAETVAESSARADEEVPFEALPRYWQEEITRKREAEARYRTRAQQYEQAFDGYDDDTRQQLLTYFQLAKRAEAGDAEAARELQSWLGDDDDTPDDTPDFPTTREEYEEFVREAARQEAERILSERESYQQQQAAVEGVRQTAEGMGYEFGSPDYILLLKFANELDPAEHPDLLAAAHAQVEAYHDSILERKQQSYLAQKEADTLGAPKVAAQGGNPDLSAGPPKTFAEARARMDERLANT